MTEGTGMREALEAALTAAYRKGAQDGHRYGPVVAHWDYPLLHARALFSSTGDERREALAMALPLIERHAPKDDCDEYTATASFIRSLLHADGGEKP